MDVGEATQKESPTSGAEDEAQGLTTAKDGDVGSHLFVFTNDKAGMGQRTSTDKERANRIIYEMSKNSSYFKQAELQDKKVDIKVAEMKTKLRSLDMARRNHLARQADKIAIEFEAQRELDGVCMVVDMDMFYAAVEIRDRPELADKPVAVGGEAMISTTNYHARNKGVRSAMPGFIGRKLCPDLVFVKTDFTKYTRVAEQIRAIFREYDPRMRSYSLDEAYLNITQAVLARMDDVEGRDALAATMAEAAPNAPGLAHRLGASLTTAAVGSLQRGLASDEGLKNARGPSDAHNAKSDRFEPDEVHEIDHQDEEDEDEEEHRKGSTGDARERSAKGRRRARMFEVALRLAEEIRGRIREATKLTASVGIGPNFMLAKIASDWNKPDGQFGVAGDRAEVLRFLHDLPVRKIPGVGKVMEKCLREALGVVSCGDLYRERAACMHVMTPHTSRWLTKVSLGIGSSDHDVATEQAEAAGAVTRKQISKERTFGELHRPQDLLAKCREICESLATEMEKKALQAKSVGLKIKTTKFQVRTQDSSGHSNVSSADELYAIASSLLEREIRQAETSAPGGKLRLRLMGVKAFGFRGQAGNLLARGQPTLDGFLATPAAPSSSPGGQQGVLGTRPDSEKHAHGGDEAVSRGAKEAGIVDPSAGSCISPRSPGGSDSHRSSTIISRHRSSGEAAIAHVSSASPRPSLLGSTKRSSLHLPRVVGHAVGESPKAAPTVATKPITCPVCGVGLGSVNNADLNRHVDACLGLDAADAVSGATPTPPARKGDRVRGSSFGARHPKRPKTSAVAAADIQKFFTPREDLQ